MNIGGFRAGDGLVFVRARLETWTITDRSATKVITITLAEALVGEVQGNVGIQDSQGGFGGALLEEVSSSGGLVWQATINGNTGGTVNASQATGVDITFFGIAQSDVSIVIDSISVVPGPVTVLLLLVTTVITHAKTPRRKGIQ